MGIILRGKGVWKYVESKSNFSSFEKHTDENKQACEDELEEIDEKEERNQDLALALF